MMAVSQKYATEPHRTVLSVDEIEDFANRHFYEQMEHRTAKAAELQEKYVSELVTPSQLTDEEMQESLARVYHTSVEHKQSTMRALHTKYVTSRDQKTVRKSDQEIQEAVKVLSVSARARPSVGSASAVTWSASASAYASARQGHCLYQCLWLSLVCACVRRLPHAASQPLTDGHTGFSSEGGRGQ